MGTRVIVLALTSAVAAGCGGPALAPCIPSSAEGERFCAIQCLPQRRDTVACPEDLPHRTRTPRADVCRASEDPLPEAICAQIPGGCGDEPGPDLAPWRAALAEQGVHLEICEDRYGLRWEGDPSSREPTAEERARLLAIDGVTAAGVGVCCGSPAPCASLYYRRSVTDPARIAADVGRAMARVEGEGLVVVIHPSGLVGPRCAADSPLCLPEAYEGCAAATYDPNAPRVPHDLGTHSGHCAHDGECVQAGCGNACVHWDETGPGTCEGYTPVEPVYCGCVEGACRWFTQ